MALVQKARIDGLQCCPDMRLLLYYFLLLSCLLLFLHYIFLALLISLFSLCSRTPDLLVLLICGSWGPFQHSGSRKFAQQKTIQPWASHHRVTMSASGYSRQPSLGFSDSGDEKHVDTNGGDYSTRMSELFDDDDVDTPTVSAPRFDFDDDDDDDDEEAFVYDGADAQVTRTSYREQLREVLDDDDDDDDDDTAEEHEVERSLLHDREHPPIAVEDEALVSSLQSKHACSMLISRGAHTPRSSH
jgi:hypothetical protein